MPILNDIMDHDVIGPAIRKGREQGLEQGLEKGRKEEAIRMLHRQITERFGAPSTATEKRLAKMSVAELEDLGIRLLRATSVTNLFSR